MFMCGQWVVAAKYVKSNKSTERPECSQKFLSCLNKYKILCLCIFVFIQAVVF